MLTHVSVCDFRILATFFFFFPKQKHKPYKSFASFEGPRLCFGLGLCNEQRGNKVVTRSGICVHGHTCFIFYFFYVTLTTIFRFI